MFAFSDLFLTLCRRGFFGFSQMTLPLLLESVTKSPHAPSLIITGATASTKGSAQFGPFAAGKFALRALGQSLSREFGPQGVHVAHAIIDGIIDTPKTKNYGNSVEDGKIKPESVSYKASTWISILTHVSDRRRVLVFAYTASICVFSRD